LDQSRVLPTKKANSLAIAASLATNTTIRSSATGTSGSAAALPQTAYSHVRLRSGGVSDDFAETYAAHRTLRLADGPDKVHP
jgi:hypothetical protein